MKPKFYPLVLVLLIFSVALSACAGGTATTASGWPGVNVSQETAYLAYNQQVYAINLANGQEQWRYPEKPNAQATFYAAPAITEDNQLIVGSYGNTLYSLDPQSGIEKWSYKAKNRFIASPLAIDGKIFAPTADDVLYAFDLNGSLSWSFKTQGVQWARPVSDPECQCVYLTSMDHRIYSIDAQTGTENWTTEDLGGAIVGTPAYSPDKILYIGTFAAEMLAIDAKTGRVTWRTPTNGWVWGGPVLKDGRLYFGDLSGNFYALDAANGDVLWTMQSDGAISDSPLVLDELLYFTTKTGSLVSLNLDGSTRWSKNLGGTLYAAPVSAGDLILVTPVGKDELLLGLDREGNQKWAFIPEKK